METVGLLRGNPKLSGNVKISVSSKDEIFLNSIDANKELSDSRFKRVVVNPNSRLSTDIYEFFDRGGLASNIIYDTLRTTDDNTSKQDFAKHFEQQYNYGLSRCGSDFFDETYRMFAPIWLTKKIPKFFIVFKNPEARNIQYDRNPDKLLIGNRYTVFGDENIIVSYGTNKYVNGESFVADITTGDTYTITGTKGYVVLDDQNFEFNEATDPSKFIENFVSPSDIVTIFDLREGTNIGNYIRNHINDPLFSTKSVEVDFNNKQFIYNGIDLDTGIISSAVESMDAVTDQELGIIDFDEFITQGFERHRLISSNLLNLEFMFDDNKSDDYTFNRYFGFYCDDEDMGSFFIDKPAMFSKQGLYRNMYHDKDFLPQYYGNKIVDEGGIKIVPDEINNVEGYIFRKPEIEEKPSFYYLKDKRSGFHKFNNLATTEYYTLMDKEIDSELLFGVNNDHFEIEATKFSDGGKASMVFTINQQMGTGYSIQFFQGNTSLGYIIADHLPDVTIPELQLLEEGSYSGNPNTLYGEGESIEHFFYPTGTPEQIAQGMATAVDWLLKDKNIDATAIGDQVFLKAQFVGADYNKFRMIVIYDDGEVTTTNNRFTGGTTTSISRVRVDKDLPLEITGDSFVMTDDNGYVRIADISYYLEEPIFEEGLVIGFKHLNTYKVITIVDENKKIKIKKGDIFVHNEIPLKMGVFSLYDIKDFDFDTFTTNYAKAYTNEYNKYFKTSSSELDIGNNYVVHKLETDQEKPIIEHGGINHTSTGYDISFIDAGAGEIRISGNVINDFSSGRIIVRNSTGNDGVYTHGTPTFVAGETVIFISGTFPDNNIDGVLHASFIAINEDFNIIAGNPIVINEKYYNDEELKKFIGFNELNTGELLDFDQNNTDIDDLVNKSTILSFDGSKVEYNRLRENHKSKNVLKSKIIPVINKWVLEGGNNIRDVEYRLNSSDAFGELNFTPSFVDEDQNPKFFTHEWLYLGAIPENASDEDLFNSSSYFGKSFDRDKYLDTINNYFLNYFTVDDYIRRLPIIDSIAQSEKWLLTGMVGGIITMQIQNVFFSEPFSIGFPQTVTNWVVSHGTAVNTLGINVVDDLNGGLTFTAVEAGVPFNVYGFAAGVDGLWTKSAVTKNIGNRLLEAPTSSRFTTFEQVSNRKYQTFFRGVRVNLDSEQFDYAGYKFSAVLNFKKTKYLEKQPPFEIEVIENRDFKNITFLVTIVIDDYKVVPDLGVGKEPFGEYLYLYIMESLKRYDDNKYGFGQIFDYPPNFAVNFHNSGVDGDPLGNITALPIGLPITNFRGLQLFHDIDMVNLPNADTLKFDNSRFLFTDFFKVRENGLFGRIIGIDKSDAMVITSTNPFYSPNEYVLDRPSTILGIGTQENLVQLKNTGFSIIQIPFLTAVAQYTVSGVHFGIYPLNNMVWFEENGGKSAYEKIANLLSFGKILDIVNSNDEKHISYKLIDNGVLTDNSDMKLSFIQPSEIKRDNALGVTELNILKKELPEENIVDYTDAPFAKNVTHYRYGGNFIPKFKDVLFFKNDKLQTAWGLNGVTWEQSNHDWNEFDVHNPEVKTIPFSRRLFGLNTKFDTTIKDFGIIKNHYHHKVSSTNTDLLLLDKPIYPSVGEIAIDKMDYNIFLSDFDASFYKNYFNKNGFEKMFGYFNTGDEKSYLGTKLVQLEEKIVLFDFEDISQDVEIDDPSFGLEGREVVYETRGNLTIFRISIRKTITEYIQNRLLVEFKKFVNEFNTFSGTFDKAVRAYIEDNITELYSITNIKLFVKKYNEDENIPLLSVESNSLLLIQQGYREDKNISTVNIDDLEVILKYNTGIEHKVGFSIYFTVEK